MCNVRDVNLCISGFHQLVVAHVIVTYQGLQMLSVIYSLEIVNVMKRYILRDISRGVITLYQIIFFL